MKEGKYYAVWVNDELLASRDYHVLQGAANAKLPFGPGVLQPSAGTQTKAELRREADEKDGRLVIF